MVIGVRDIVSEDGAAEGEPDSRGHVQVLDRNRHAEQRWQVTRLGGVGDRALRLAGLFAREISGYREKGADLRAEAVDALQVVIEDFHG